MHLLAGDAEVAAIRHFQQIQAAQQGALTGTAGTDNGQYAAVLYRQRNIAHYVQITETLFQVLDPNSYGLSHKIHSQFFNPPFNIATKLHNCSRPQAPIDRPAYDRIRYAHIAASICCDHYASSDTRPPYSLLYRKLCFCSTTIMYMVTLQGLLRSSLTILVPQRGPGMFCHPNDLGSF